MSQRSGAFVVVCGILVALLMVLGMMTPTQLLRQWDDGYPVRSCKMGADNDEHRIQCMAFEILRRFIAHPNDFEALQHANDPLSLGRLVLALGTLPALKRMQPFTNIQLAQAVYLAQLLAGRDDARIPNERRFLVRRLAVVANAVGRRRIRTIGVMMLLAHLDGKTLYNIAAATERRVHFVREPTAVTNTSGDRPRA